MRTDRWSLTLLSAVVLAAGLPLACGGAGSDPPKGETTGSSSTGGGAGGAGGDDVISTGSSQDQPLTISPPSATIDVVDGVASPVKFSALLGGSPVTPSWIVDLSSIAGVDAAGVVTATGNLGGEVVLDATYGGKSVTAKIAVNIAQTIDGVGVEAADKALLEGASDPDPTTQWTYPYDGTVFPKGLLAPELMWNNGGAEDTYLVRYTGKYVDIKVFTKAPPPSRAALPDASWKQLTESGKGGPVSLHVARLVPGAPSATVVVKHGWKIANGSLRGTVYYWANNLGRVLRIKPGSAAPEDFLLEAGESGCSTCHSVSANGSTMILGGDIGASTWDLLTNTQVLGLGSVGKPVRNWAMPAISPNGKIVVENNAPLPGPPGGSDGMFDAVTGQKLLGTGLDGMYLHMPAFSPDGSKLVYVDSSTLGLGVFDFSVAMTTVSNQTFLTPAGSDADWNAICFPSVAPDSKWAVYHRGKYPQSLDTRFGFGDLYMASLTNAAVEMRLDEANGEQYPFAAGDRDRKYNYEPTFAPLNSGGYAWIVFTSRRTYGNRLTGAKGEVKQLWVAALDQDTVPGQDPSHPAFWVPGQDLDTWNMRGFWALDPCKPAGETCTSGSECCNLNCVDGVCKDPDPSECVADGNFCSVAADCCTPSAKCINNVCSEPPPQ